MPDEVSIIRNNMDDDRNLFIGVVYHFLTDTIFNLDHGMLKKNYVYYKEITEGAWGTLEPQIRLLTETD